jgi:hypothetical protein
VDERNGRKRMARIDSEIMKSTGDLHDKIRKAIFGVTKNVFNNSTALDTSNGVLNNNPCARNDFVHPFFISA